MSEDTETPKRSVVDGVADGIGGAIQGLFYIVGRASPIVADVAEAITKTRVGSHVTHNAHLGWVKGWNATMEAREKRKRRAVRSKFKDKVVNGVHRAKEGLTELVDMVQEDIDQLRGEGGDPKPEPAG